MCSTICIHVQRVPETHHPMTDNTAPETLRRFDPISYSDMGGWSWDSGAIKECADGDFVRFEDHEAIVAMLQARLRSLTEAAQVVADALHEACDYARVYEDAPFHTGETALSLLAENGVTPTDK
jgi:hypothetical protein